MYSIVSNNRLLLVQCSATLQTLHVHDYLRHLNRSLLMQWLATCMTFHVLVRLEYSAQIALCAVVSRPVSRTGCPVLES